CRTPRNTRNVGRHHSYGWGWEIEAPRSTLRAHGRVAPLTGVGVDRGVTDASFLCSQSIRCVEYMSTRPAFNGVLALAANCSRSRSELRSHDGLRSWRSRMGDRSPHCIPFG